MLKTIWATVSQCDKYKNYIWKYFFSKESMKMFGTTMIDFIKFWKDIIWIRVYNSKPKQFVHYIFRDFDNWESWCTIVYI